MYENKPKSKIHIAETNIKLAGPLRFCYVMMKYP
jgi:hypothetical protein